VTAREAKQAARALRLLLEKVAAGELDAPPALIRRLEGSLSALEAMSKRGQR
jgi:hypothetical protein